MLASRSAIQKSKESEVYLLNRRREQLKDQLKEESATKPVSKYKQVWRHECSLGTINLCFGEYPSSREHFAEGAAFKIMYLYVVIQAHRNNRRLGGDWNAYLQNAEDTLETAILGGGRDIESRAVERVRDHTDEDAKKPYFKYWHNRVQALAALVDDDTTEAKRRIEQAENYIDAVDFDMDTLHLDLLYGLCANDAEAVETASQMIAETYADRYDLPIDLAKGSQLMSYHAVAGLALARRRGLDVHINHDAVPSVVCDHDWGYRTHGLSDLAATALSAIDTNRN